MRVIWTRAAARGIERAYDYLADFNPRAAMHVAETWLAARRDICLKRAMIARPLLFLPVLLAACGEQPEPFLGNPGATARRLAVPVTPMLAVPPPARAALTDQSARDFADLLALSLVKEEVPALARAPQKNDWRLVVTAGRENDLGCLWPGDDGEAPDGPATGQGDDEDGSAVYERTGQR